ncbi:MAG: tripartite tricarboxylate transporter substrate binding protein [Casimicrobiaceae bacterium]
MAAYPDHPIRLVVPFGPGGGTDLLARVVAEQMSRALGQPVVVENKAGAGGTIGTDFVAKSKPDGYTLLMGTNATLALAPGLYKQLPYDPLKDLTPVTSIATGPSILTVNPTVPVSDVRSLVAYLKSKPGELNYGSAGNGSMAHIATSLMDQLAGTRSTHVPFRGGAAATQELVAGRLQFMIAGPVETVPLVEAGKVRALAVTTPARFPGLPALPTMAEAGIPGYEITNWFGIFAPAGTPQDIVDRLASSVAPFLADPAAGAAFVKQGVQPAPMSGAEYRAFVQRDVAKWTREVRALNIATE